MPACDGSTPRVEVRNTALQSSTAASVRKTAKQRMPMNNTNPRGIAKTEPLPSPPYGSRCGTALTNAPKMETATQSVDASGDAPMLSRALTPPDPTMPPTLKRPWEAGHHWASARSLDNDRLDVHDAVQRPHTSAEDKQCRHEQRFPGSCCQQRQAHADYSGR